MARGIEDTAFYRYFPLASLNEVGGDLARGVTTIEEFHAKTLPGKRNGPGRLSRRPRTTPNGVKTSGKVERSFRDSALVAQGRESLGPFEPPASPRGKRPTRPQPKRRVPLLSEFDRHLAPGRARRRSTGQLTERMQTYMEKASREAKLQTQAGLIPFPNTTPPCANSWPRPLMGARKTAFWGEFRRFHKQIVNWGLYTALSQTLLKLTSPGVPDIYQGQELWDFSLVDPDNRRPVDFAYRKEMLAKLRENLSAT